MESTRAPFDILAHGLCEAKSRRKLVALSALLMAMRNSLVRVEFVSVDAGRCEISG